MTTATGTRAKSNGAAESSEFQPTGMMIIPEKLNTQIRNIEAVIGQVSHAMASEAIGGIARAVMTSRAIKAIRGALSDELLDEFMGLMNSPLGFMTDRMPGGKDNKAPYGKEIVRDCLAEAFIRGVSPFGNEMNIIANRCYITQAGYVRKVRELDGLTDLVETPGTPIVKEGQTLIRYAATWKYHGRGMSLVDGEGKPGRVFVIPSNQYLGPDAIIGKAKRKALKAIFEMCTGSVLDDEPEDQPTPATPQIAAPAASKGDALANRLGSTPPPAPAKQLDEYGNEVGDAAE